MYIAADDFHLTFFSPAALLFELYVTEERGNGNYALGNGNYALRNTVQEYETIIVKIFSFFFGKPNKVTRHRVCKNV